MLELFILGELMSDGPAHGYLLHRILSQVLGPLRPVSWGTLYGILNQLETQGAIVEVKSTGPSEGRPRRVYDITDVGRERFFRLMSRPLDHSPAIEDMFRIKVSKFHPIDRDQRRSILTQYQTFLELMIDGSDMNRERIEQVEEISDDERPSLLAVLDYDRSSYQARLQWVLHAQEALSAQGARM
ncbi:MAG: PadR family transcriptional regulator [Firmicutes bacterium]|nr:PadR family transcriptional regulator [Bacillota bacterium]